jgi:hypothetical protein
MNTRDYMKSCGREHFHSRSGRQGRYDEREADSIDVSTLQIPGRPPNLPARLDGCAAELGRLLAVVVPTVFPKVLSSFP